MIIFDSSKIATVIMAGRTYKVKAGRRDSRFYLVLAGVVVLLLAFETLLSSLPFAEEVLAKLSDFQVKELDTYVEMNKLLTTLATLALGATTGFAVKLQRNIGVPPAQARKAVASWTLAGASLYCGHLSYQRLVWMLDSKFFNLVTSGAWLAARAQFWTFLLSVIILADLSYDGLRARSGAGGAA